MIQAMFIILAVTLPVVAALRSVLSKRVQALMLRKSPQTGSGSPMSREASEVAAPTTPRVMLLDGGSLSGQDDEARYAETRQARSLFRRWWVYDAVGVSGVLAIWQLFFWSVGGQFSNLSAINWLGAGYLIVISLRYAFYVGQYKDRAIGGAKGPGWFRRWVGVAPEHLFRLLVHPRNSWYPLLFIVYSIYVAARTFIAWWFWASLILLVPLMLRVHLVRLARKSTNRRLLLLRVFGRDKSTILTFGAIRRYWQHIGPTFTVVDPSYLRYKYRGHSEDHVALAFFSCVAYAAVAGTPEFNAWWGIAVFLSAINILIYLVALVIMYLRAPRSFAASAAQVRERLQKFLRRPRRWDLSFKDLDMYCFENTWQDAIAAFVGSADVVLMDLRGYSVQNKGCETEINYLFDNFPIDRIVFLVDNETDNRAIEKLVRKLWELLEVNSPNLAVSEPVATVYDIKDQRAGDVKGLINILVAAARKETVKPNRRGS